MFCNIAITQKANFFLMHEKVILSKLFSNNNNITIVIIEVSIYIYIGM